MRTHEQFADELALYALNELHGGELQEFEQHLETCACLPPRIAGHAQRSRPAGIVGGWTPAARAQQRTADARHCRRAARRSAPPRPFPPRGRRNFWLTWIPAAIALAVHRLRLSLRQSNQSLHDQLAELRNRYNDQRVQLAQAQENMRLLLAPDAVHVSLTPPKCRPASQRNRHLQPVAEPHDPDGEQSAAGASGQSL